MDHFQIGDMAPGVHDLGWGYDETEADVRLTPLQALEVDKATVQDWLWMMPLESAKELSDTTGLTLGRIYQVLKTLRRHGLVTRASLGRARGVRQRWWLTTQGVLQTAGRLGRPIPWQVTETGLRQLIHRLPAVEDLYAVAPRVWSRPDVWTPREVFLTPDPDETPAFFSDDLKLTAFEWIRDGEIHAVAHYANGSWVPMIWIGSLVSGTVIERKAEAARGQLQDNMFPTGWVIFCDDALAAKQAADAWNEVNALVLAGNGTSFRQMRPSVFSLPALQEKTSPKDLGAPEAIVQWLEKDGAMIALNGGAAYDLFGFIAEFSGATPKQVRAIWGQGYRGILRPLRRAQLIVRLDGHFYLDRAGILEAARMNRISWQSVESRVGAYLKPDGVYRKNQTRHNTAVVDVAVAAIQRRSQIYGGWRAVHDIPGVTQVIADAVVLTGPDDGPREELFIEVEFTARTPSQIQRKLDPYWLVLQHTGRRLLVLFLVEDARTRQRYATMGAGLITVRTLQEFLNGELD